MGERDHDNDNVCSSSAIARQTRRLASISECRVMAVSWTLAFGGRGWGGGRMAGGEGGGVIALTTMFLLH